jgi:hypothetical protein
MILTRKVPKEELTKYFDGLDINIKYGESVVFLDLIISMCCCS